jgi:hypothetical protein
MDFQMGFLVTLKARNLLISKASQLTFKTAIVSGSASHISTHRSSSTLPDLNVGRSTSI